MTACGLCSSTDLKIIGYGSVGEMPIEYPTLVGHEGIGVIEKVGSKAGIIG
ncbi:MAG: alcohol dehydrogenase catalytic domain-containing protein [Eubacteriales bacterium]